MITETITSETYTCEYCGKQYRDEELCKMCEINCEEMFDCKHEWKYRIYPSNDSINFYCYELSVRKICSICYKTEERIFKNFDSIFNREG